MDKDKDYLLETIFINPSIYIFDDCLSAIDANKEKLILENLKGKIDNNTNIIISHRTTSINIIYNSIRKWRNY